MSITYEHMIQVRKAATFPAAITDTASEVVGKDPARMAVEFINTSETVTCYGSVSPDVTTATGRPLAPGKDYTDNVSGDAWWWICDTVLTVDMRVTVVRK